MNILICEQVSCFAYKNNIHHLTLGTDNYKFYRLYGMRNGDLLSWEIEEETLEDNYIPENTLIFVFDPDLVDGLRPVSWKKENQMRLLPDIIMDKTKSYDEFAAAMNYACLSAMDLDAYHKREGSQSLKQNQVVAKLSNHALGRL